MQPKAVFEIYPENINRILLDYRKMTNRIKHLARLTLILNEPIKK